MGTAVAHSPLVVVLNSAGHTAGGDGGGGDGGASSTPLTAPSASVGPDVADDSVHTLLGLDALPVWYLAAGWKDVGI